jgi:hypothetical protein
VHVALDVALDPPASFELRLDCRAGGAQRERAGHVERHIVSAEVRVELGQAMHGKVGPPAVRLESGNLGKPLTDEVKGACVARAHHHAGQLVVPNDVEVDRLTGRDLARQLHARVGLVVVPRPVELGVGP